MNVGKQSIWEGGGVMDLVLPKIVDKLMDDKKDNSMKDFMSMYTFVKEMGNGSGETGLADVMQSAIKELGNFSKTIGGNQPRERKKGRLENAKPQIKKQIQPTGDNPLIKLKEYLDEPLSQLLEHGAKPRREPQQFVDAVFEALSHPQEGDAFTYNLFSNKNALRWLAELNPEVADHEEWFAELGMLIMSEFSEDDTLTEEGTSGIIETDTTLETVNEETNENENSESETGESGNQADPGDNEETDGQA